MSYHSISLFKALDLSDTLPAKKCYQNVHFQNFKLYYPSTILIYTYIRCFLIIARASASVQKEILFKYNIKALHMTRNARGDKAEVPATKLPLTYRILTLSFPLHKDYVLHPRVTALERE